MAHLTTRSGYRQFVDRLNLAPQGAPGTESLFKILALLVSESEATLLSKMPLKPTRLATVARAWGVDEATARDQLEQLARRGMILDITREDGSSRYFLPPPMAGFFEFAFMRVREDLDQKRLAELMEQYIMVEDDFIRELVCAGPTQMARFLVQERALEGETHVEVMDYERASRVIGDATSIAVGICYCRHRKEHLGKACSAPQHNCMTFGTTAEALIKHGIARRVDKKAALDILVEAIGHNLVQFCENVRRDVAFMCHCCGCCCEALHAVRRHGLERSLITSNFIARIEAASCTGCGRCVKVCPVESITLDADSNDANPRRRRARVLEKRCIGCAVCVRNCPEKCIRVEARERRVMTPVDTFERVVIMALERGKLQNLVFSDRVRRSHRAMAVVLSVILRLPAARRAVAQKQLGSRYLDYLVSLKSVTPA